MDKITAVYTRVSSAQQTTKSQKPDLTRWVDAQDPDTIGKVQWFHDSATGKNMDRTGWLKLQAAIDTGQVIWRLDRLGLCTLFEDLQAKKVRLVSLRDSIDLGTASSRLMANMLASVAAFETEIRGERVKASGKTWGGSKKGWR
jgi:DNA invertase Pin-like site-specific DNA recombinase